MSKKLSILFLVALGLFFAPKQKAEASHQSIYHSVQTGETLSEIALWYDVPLAELAALNQLKNPNLIYTGQRLLIPQPQYKTYTVQIADTLSEIAESYSTTMDTLRELNNITDINLLEIGRIITVPDFKEWQSANTPLPTHKKIIVDISEQHVYLFEDNILQHSFIASTGRHGAETVPGRYTIQSKIPTAYAYSWNFYMDWWMGIYWVGPLENGFHAVPRLENGSLLWGDSLGIPNSYGCVVLGMADAEQLYQWTDIGTEVVIQP